MVKQTRKVTPVKKRIVHHAKHVFVPHKGNQYRPHLIRWKGLTAVLALALLIQTSYGLITTGKLQVLGYASNISVTDLVKDTNIQREKEGLGDVTMNSALNRAAYAKAQDMFANNYWAHTSPSGVTPWTWLASEHYDYNSAGENLAKNYPTAQATMDAWMASPTHKANILKPAYKDVGFAVVDGTLDGKPTTLVVAYYGEPLQGVASGAPITLVSSVNAGSSNPLEYFGSVIHALNPATLAILALFAIVAIVAALAQHFRKKLPKAWRVSWKVHHGMFTMLGVLVVMALVVIGSGAGQI
jgi:uncharacterized protein YkwD